MKKLLFLLFLITGIIYDSGAVTRTGGRATTRSSGTQSVAEANTPGSTDVSAARAARAARTSPPATPTTGTVVRARSATAPAQPTKQPSIAARASAKQKVIGTGTKVSAAAKNIIVSDECREKYEGCMDSFCMLDNDTGGRCLCSNKNKELDAILAEIENLDQQSYQMATFGVERIEMGDDADIAIQNATNVANSISNPESEKNKTARKALDLSAWDIVAGNHENENIFGDAAGIENLTGDALHSYVMNLCTEQIPECAGEIGILKMMYTQQIRSDCTAYENSLKQQKQSSAQKLAAAERALREAALEQYRSANKYDLGQCTVQFKKCMQTTGGCGEDFSNCASVVAMDNTNTRKSTSSKIKTYKIQGEITNIEISASTYDTLAGKKPLCESVTKSCITVADQVWDTFLRDIAPQVKNAELIAEDKARQDCIGNISSCFQKACKDNIDPNDPDGSYDMCLSRPATMLNLCKVPLNACGIDATSEKTASNSQIWDFVVARLSSMRVDSCTTQVKQCLQSEERCGEDYTQCIGLDFNALKEMCPLEKLVGCQQENDDGEFTASWNNIENIVQGIWLAIDNATLEECQNIVNEKLIELCGDTATCIAFEEDNDIGTESLISYQENDGDYVIEGLISFGNVKIEKTVSTDDNVKFGKYEIDINNYKEHLDDTDPVANRVVSALQSTANKINQKIAVLSQDPKIDMCVNGREMKQINGREKTSGRFPYLLDSAVMLIISSGLDKANKNYTAKYNELLGKALEAKDDAIKSVLCAAMASNERPQCTQYISNAGVAVCTKYSAQTFDNVFASSSDTGLSGDDMYSTKYTITGAKLADLASVQQKGHSEFTQTDSYGNMVGKIAMSSVYSPDKNTCTLTTTTTMCETMKEIITVDTTTTCRSGGISILGGGGNCDGGGGLFGLGGSSKTTTVNQTFEGVACTKFMEPTTTTTTVKM